MWYIQIMPYLWKKKKKKIIPVTHQAGGLQSRGGSVDPSHSWHSLIVINEPFCPDDQFWCVRYQVLFTEDGGNTFRERDGKNDLLTLEIENMCLDLFQLKQIACLSVFLENVLFWQIWCIAATDGMTHRLCSDTISGLRGSRNILGSDRIPPDGKPTMTKRTPPKM